MEIELEPIGFLGKLARVVIARPYFVYRPENNQFDGLVLMRWMTPKIAVWPGLRSLAR